MALQVHIRLLKCSHYMLSKSSGQLKMSVFIPRTPLLFSKDTVTALHNLESKDTYDFHGQEMTIDELMTWETGLEFDLQRIKLCYESPIAAM